MKCNSRKVEGQAPTLSDLTWSGDDRGGEFWFYLEKSYCLILLPFRLALFLNLSVYRMARGDVDSAVSLFTEMGMERSSKSYWQLEVADTLVGRSYQVKMTIGADGERIYSCTTSVALFVTQLALPYHKYSVKMAIKAKREVEGADLQRLVDFIVDIPLKYASLPLHFFIFRSLLNYSLMA